MINKNYIARYINKFMKNKIKLFCVLLACIILASLFFNLMRIILGFLVVLFIPGFLLSLLLFKNMEVIERISYSLILSTAIIIIDGTILNFVWEISLLPMLATLIPLILIFGFFVLKKTKHWKRI